MLRAIDQTLRKHRLIRRGDHVLVAVSGGADSVALAYALHFLRKRHHLQLTLAHLNHGIRGRAADEDARFVNELAWRLGLPCMQARIDVPRRAQHDRVSLEMAARDARYEYFARTAREVGADRLATAHTADDQVETIVLKMARGAGARGLGGIPYESVRRGLRVIRPMRDISHREAVAFLKRHGLAWREDQSNHDPAFLRNRVRYEILPILESRLNPQIRRALLRAGEVLRAEDEWLDQLAQKQFARCLARKGGLDLRVDRLGRLPLAARRRVLRLWLAAGGVDLDEVDFDAVERAEHLLEAPAGTRSVPLSERRRIVRRYQSLRLEGAGRARDAAFRCALIIPGETILPEQGLRIVTRWDHGLLRQTRARIGQFPAEASFGAAAVRRGRIVVRSWQPGDRIRPFGFGGSCKLQDVFVDQKIPADQRAAVPVLECRGEILWVPGYRVAQGWEVPDPAGASLHVWVQRL